MTEEEFHSGRAELKKGPWLEQLIFNNRVLIIVAFVLITVFLGYHALQIRPNASFLRMLPTYHPYVQNFMKHHETLKGMGNVVRIAVKSTNGDIFTASYLKTLQQIHDDVFYIPGVDRGKLESLWSPTVRWTEVTEQGFDGGRVIPDEYDGSDKSLRQVQINVFKSGKIGSLVANNFQSSVIYAPLQDISPETGMPLDYSMLSDRLEKIRNQYKDAGVTIHITGFAKIIGDLIDGSTRVALFFGVAFIILLIFLYITARSFRSTFVRAIPSIIAVIWLLGLLRIMGYGMNPYSMLVPFLMFSLAVSHSIQMGNAKTIAMLNGADKLTAARLAFRKIYIPGLAALITDGIGFATLFVIRIGVIRDIAAGATMGVAVVIFTNMILLPVLMSYIGRNNNRFKELGVKNGVKTYRAWSLLAQLTRRHIAISVTVLAFIGLMFGVYTKQGLQIGDLDRGAPELRPDSRYNKDSAFMNKNYSASSDVFVIMLETKEETNSNYNTVVAVDRLQWELQQLDGVQYSLSYTYFLKLLNSAYNEGNPKWLALPRSKVALDNMTLKVPKEFVPPGGTMTPIIVFLKDHKANTLQQVVRTVESFAARNNNDTMSFKLAAGNSGIEAAVNIEIEKAKKVMTALVYLVVFFVCMSTFRSFRAAFCIVVPLLLTSVLCEALMTWLGIGVKVATLPVIAVGVGIGVDYGIYIYSMLKERLLKGETLFDAYFKTLKSTGQAVTFTGVTLAVAVGTWVFSPIKFQADMGILLTFMFLWNMLGALCLLPALVSLIGVPGVSKDPIMIKNQSGTNDFNEPETIANADLYFKS